MNNLQILSLVRSCPKTNGNFQGVFASDMLPQKTRKRNSSYICNLDPSHMPGSHWICIYFPPKGPPEYFDSFGFPPRKPFKRILGKSYRFNPYFIQYPLSTTCGQYCIYFLWQRSLNKSMNSILSQFDKDNLLYNDMFVNNEIEKHFSVDLDVFDMDFISSQLSVSFKQLENKDYYKDIM